MIAVSTDDVETLKKFRESLTSKDTFVSDGKAVLIEQYDNKMLLLNMAKRTTFVIGRGRKILAVIEGSDAVDPQNSLQACTPPAPRPDAPNQSKQPPPKEEKR